MNIKSLLLKLIAAIRPKIVIIKGYLRVLRTLTTKSKNSDLRNIVTGTIYAINDDKNSSFREEDLASDDEILNTVISKYNINLENITEGDINILNVIIDYLTKDVQGSSEDEPFGKYAFAELRDDVPFEINTDIENKCFNDLETYINKNIAIKDENVEVLKKIISSKKYNDILKPTSFQLIYRGLSLTDADMINYFGGLPNSTKGYLEDKFQYVDFKEYSSWTDNIAVARVFSSEKISYTRPWSIVLYANSRDTININLNNLYDIISTEFATESEILVLQKKIDIYAFSWFKNYSKFK